MSSILSGQFYPEQWSAGFFVEGIWVIKLSQMFHIFYSRGIWNLWKETEMEKYKDAAREFMGHHPKCLQN